MLHFSRRYGPLLLLGFWAFSYGFNRILSESPAWIATADLLPPLLSACGTYYASRHVNGPLRFFWSMLSLGAVFYFIAQFIWVYYAWLQGIHAPRLSLADIFWSLQIAVFIIGLCRLLYTCAGSGRGLRFAFDTFVTAMALTMLIVEWIWKPYLESLTGDVSFLSLFINVLYPISDLVIAIGFYAVIYMIPNLFDRRQLAFMASGMLLYVIADTCYLLMLPDNSYSIGSWIDPLYNLALLMIGYSGLYPHPSAYAMNRRGLPEPVDDDASSRFAGHLIPYLCIALLVGLLLFRQNQWNSLTVTAALLILAILVRQLVIQKQYDKLVGKYKSLFIQHQFWATHDELTRLPNRRYFLERLKRELELATLSGNRLAVLYLDLERLKNVFNSMGRPFGEMLITGVSERIGTLLQDGQTLARMGGDQFALILPGIRNFEEAARFSREVIDAVSRPFHIDKHEVQITAAIGIARFPDDGGKEEELLKKADLAMYKAKAAEERIFVYTGELDVEINRRKELESALRRALDKEEFFLMYQPQFTTGDMKPVGVEALLRWKRAEGITVTPSAFLHLAEETGLMIPIGEWVLRQACRQAVEWENKGSLDWIMSVNISAKQLLQKGFVEKVGDILKETGMNPKRLVFELSESLPMDEMTARMLQRLKNQGIRIAMDEFGTGFPTLNSLRQFRVDTLKISQEFTKQLEEKPEQLDILKAIQAMAQSLRLHVVAGGIETKEAYELLKSASIGTGQGYFFSRPITSEELEKRYLSLPKMGSEC